MSVSVSLNIQLESNERIPCKSIILLLIQGGWNIVKDETIIYLPLNDDEMFNWEKAAITIPEFIKVVDEKDSVREMVGVEISWLSTDIGGHLIMRSGDDFTINLNINTKHISNQCRLPDFNWYAEKIIDLVGANHHILTFNFQVE